MVIVYRSNDSKDKPIPEGWDGNRFDVRDPSLPAPLQPQTVNARSVCTIMHSDYIQNGAVVFSGKETLQWRFLANVLTGRENKIKYMDRMLWGNPGLAEAGAAFEAYDNAGGVNGTDDTIKQRHKRANDWVSEWRKPVDSLTNRIRAGPWPGSSAAGWNLRWDKFKSQTTIGDSTGYAIGPGLVATASHCVVDRGYSGAPEEAAAGGDEVWKYKAVFNFRQEGDHLAWDSIFDIKRIVLKTTWAPWPVAVPPTNIDELNRHFELTRMRNATLHDFCILEIQNTTGSHLAFPPPLILDRAPPYPDAARILYGLGHPSGMPMKLSSCLPGLRGPAIRDGPTTANLLSQRPAFSVDIDGFKGNSGGPLFDANTHRVVGTYVQGSAMNRQPPPSGPPSALETWVKQWLKEASVQGTVRREFWTMFENAIVYDDKANKIDWARYRPEELGVSFESGQNRVDVFAPFIQPLSAFTNQAQSAPLFGDVIFEISIRLGGVPAPSNPGPPLTKLEARIMLPNSGTCVCSSINCEDVNTGFVGQALTWTRKITNQQDATRALGPAVTLPSQQPPAQPVYGDVGPNVFQTPSGLCDIVAVSFASSDTSGKQHDVFPEVGRIKVIFIADPKQNLTDDRLEFEQALALEPMGTNAWIAQLGRQKDNGQRQGWWKGPKALNFEPLSPPGLL